MYVYHPMYEYILNKKRRKNTAIYEATMTRLLVKISVVNLEKKLYKSHRYPLLQHKNEQDTYCKISLPRLWITKQFIKRRVLLNAWKQQQKSLSLSTFPTKCLSKHIWVIAKHHLLTVLPQTACSPCFFLFVENYSVLPLILVRFRAGLIVITWDK